MGDKKAPLVIDDLRGGRNGYDPPWALARNQCVDAVNVDFYQSRLGHKRGGTLRIAVTGAAFTTAAIFGSLFRHVPGTDDTAAELWAVDNEATPVVGRMAGGTSFAKATLKDNPTGNSYDFTAASINGKLALAYKSAQARMHGWDTSTVRRFGLAAPTVPAVADNGGGAYAAVLRYYRTRMTRQSGGVTIGRSEPSPSVSFTPSGAGASARINIGGTNPNEGETHWEAEASLDNVTFYRIATTVIGTSTYDDTAATTTYNTNPLSATTGIYTLQKPYKFIAADQNRLLGFGSWTSTDKQHRIEFSAVIGSLDIGDEERVDTTTNYYLDLDENDSGIPTGLFGPIFGSFFAFKSRQTWRLTPTGQVSQPYRLDNISKSIGAVTQVAGCSGEDRSGNPTLYWMSHRGPYRFGTGGLEYIGRNVEDFIVGPSATIDLTQAIVSRVVYYAEKRQVWFWLAITNAADTISVIEVLIFDVATEGWSRIPQYFPIGSYILSAVAFADTIGASMGLTLKPYFTQAPDAAGANNPPFLYKGDTGTDDGAGTGVGFKAYVDTVAYEVAGPGRCGEVGDGVLLAAKATGVTITATVTGDFGVVTGTGTALLSASASGESRVIKRLEGSALAGDLSYVSYRLGDSVATTAAWNLDRLVVPVADRGPRSG